MTREERKKEYLQCFIHTFSENGLDRTPIKKLAGAAKINEASIYQYFKNKDEIVVECVRLYLNEELDRLFRVLSNPKEPLDRRVKKFIQFSAETSAEAKFIIQVLASPIYGKLCSKVVREFSEQVLSFSHMSSKCGDLPHYKAEFAIHLLFLSIVISNRVIGEDSLLRIQVEYLLNILCGQSVPDVRQKDQNYFYAV